MRQKSKGTECQYKATRILILCRKIWYELFACQGHERSKYSDKGKKADEARVKREDKASKTTGTDMPFLLIK